MGTPSTAALAAWLADFAATVHAHAAELTELDSPIGDADHGINMDRGMTAVAALNPEDFPAPDRYLKQAGMTLVSTVGGAAGPLYGTLLLRMAAAFANPEPVTAEPVTAEPLTAAPVTAEPVSPQPSTDPLGVALRAGLAGVVARGHAALGDKTMVDALTPAVDAFDAAVAAGATRGVALADAARAAAAGRDATIPLVARKGRASYLGERSAGHQDPGATSAAYLLESAARTLG